MLFFGDTFMLFQMVMDCQIYVEEFSCITESYLEYHLVGVSYIVKTWRDSQIYNISHSSSHFATFKSSQISVFTASHAPLTLFDASVDLDEIPARSNMFLSV